jgi:hypothetical protein
MSRSGPSALLLPLCGGCFSAQPGAEGNHDRIQKGMGRDEVLWAIGKPKEAHPIPGQGDSADLPVEQWRYQWTYPTGKTFTILLTAFIGLFFMDFSPYGFDVGFGRDGRVRTVSEVGRRR